jgi:hypothetical protein
VLVASALPAAINGLMSRGSRFTPAADLNHERLSALVGDSVGVVNPSGSPSELVVDHVTPRVPYASSDGRVTGHSFSVAFEGKAGVPLDQGTYELSHPNLGAFPVFLSPVGLTDGANQRYEAVFNRLR